MKTNKKLSPLTEAILEMAGDQHRLGIMDDASYRKITTSRAGGSAYSRAD